MVGSDYTRSLLAQFLSTRHFYPGAPGKKLIQQRLKSYIFKKGAQTKRGTTTHQNRKEASQSTEGPDSAQSEALRAKDQKRAAERALRRRNRGGGSVTVGARELQKRRQESEKLPGEDAMEEDAQLMAHQYVFLTALCGQHTKFIISLV